MDRDAGVGGGEGLHRAEALAVDPQAVEGHRRWCLLEVLAPDAGEFEVRQPVRIEMGGIEPQVDIVAKTLVQSCERIVDVAAVEVAKSARREVERERIALRLSEVEAQSGDEFLVVGAVAVASAIARCE